MSPKPDPRRAPATSAPDGPVHVFHDRAQAARALALAPDAWLLSPPGGTDYAGAGFYLAAAEAAGCPPGRLILDAGEDMACAFEAVAAGCAGLVFTGERAATARIRALCEARGVRLFGAPPDCRDAGPPHDFHPR